MTQSSATPLHRWRYGMHPRAKGARILAMGRVDLALGEALRLEMVDAGTDGDATVHIQYYIATDAGPWALWTTCPRSELAEREATVAAITPPLEGS